MQDDFEKRVQQKMEELNLTPSAPVWEKIELQIRPEEKRRVVYWLFFGALILAGGWWLLSPQEQSILQVTESKPSATVGQTTAAAREKQKQSPIQSITKTSTANPSAAGSGQPDIVIQQKRKSPQANLALLWENREHRPYSREAAPVKKWSAGNLPTPKTEDGSLLNGVGRSSVTEDEKTALRSTEESRITGTPAANTTDSVKAVQPMESNTKTTPVADSLTPKPKIAAAGRKWQKQVWLQGGLSQFAAGLSSVYRSVYTSRDAMSVPNTNGNGSSISINPRPTEYTRGFSFTAGVGAAKELSEHFTFHAGLQYAYYSVHSTVGNYKRIDTAVSYAGSTVAVGGYFDKDFAPGAPTPAFTTHYHFIELPVGLAWQMLEKFPLQLSLGASYGLLLQTNALTHNSPANLYYYNKENNNTSFLNLFTGLQYRILKRKGFSLSAGPQAQYTLTNLQKQVYGDQPHLFAAGIKTSISF